GKCQVQLRHYVEFQKELAINYCKLVVVSVDPPEVNAALRVGLDAEFPFLSDHDRKIVQALDMTETSKSRGVTAMPYTFSLMPDLTGGGDHWQLIIVSPAFEGRGLLEQQRMVHDALREAMRTERIHALTMRLYTPGQWDKLGS